MKLRRLPETDLARIAPLAPDEKRRQLRSFNSGGGSWSYDPARAQNFNIANPINPLGLHSERPTLETIQRLVIAQCTCEQQQASCIEVVELFDSWYQNNATISVERQIPSMPIGSLGVIRYWENFAAIIEGRGTFIFVDYRRKKYLTSLARKFVFSMMHQQIRMTDPDFYDANLAIVRFPQVDKVTRSILPYFVNDDDLYSLSELNAMIDETYSIWMEVLDERRTSEPKRAAGGGLF